MVPGNRDCLLCGSTTGIVEQQDIIHPKYFPSEVEMIQQLVWTATSSTYLFFPLRCSRLPSEIKRQDYLFLSESTCGYNSLSFLSWGILSVASPLWDLSKDWGTFFPLSERITPVWDLNFIIRCLSWDLPLDRWLSVPFLTYPQRWLKSWGNRSTNGRPILYSIFQERFMSVI